MDPPPVLVYKRTMKSIHENLTAIRARIDAACARAGRDPGRVRLVAVSKTKPASAVGDALAAGQTLFGENRVLEARDKIPLVQPAPAAAAPVWHLIGPLQRNKVKLAVRLFSMIHSVDSLSLAGEIDKRVRGQGESWRPLPVLVQVNIGGERQKHGLAPESLPEALTAMAPLPGIAIHGLMAIPPHAADAEAVRPYFKKMAELAAEMDSLGLPGVAMAELSMGMSGDFEVAVEEGATLVRVGSALFGPRPPLKTAGAAPPFA